MKTEIVKKEDLLSVTPENKLQEIKNELDLYKRNNPWIKVEGFSITPSEFIHLDQFETIDDAFHFYFFENNEGEDTSDDLWLYFYIFVERYFLENIKWIHLDYEKEQDKYNELMTELDWEFSDFLDNLTTEDKVDIFRFFLLPENIAAALKLREKAMKYQKDIMDKTTEIQQDKIEYYKKYWTFFERSLAYLSSFFNR